MKNTRFEAVDVWCGGGVEILRVHDDGQPTRQSVAIRNNDAQELGRILRGVAANGGNYGFHSDVDLNGTKAGVHLADYQGRKLFVPKKDVERVCTLLGAGEVK